MTDHSNDHELPSAGERILSDLWTAGGHLVDAAGDAAHGALHAGEAGFDLLTGDTEGAHHAWDQAGTDVSNAGAEADWAASEAHHAWDLTVDEIEH